EGRHGGRPTDSRSVEGPGYQAACGPPCCGAGTTVGDGRRGPTARSPPGHHPSRGIRNVDDDGGGGAAPLRTRGPPRAPVIVPRACRPAAPRRDGQFPQLTRGFVVGSGYRLPGVRRRTMNSWAQRPARANATTAAPIARAIDPTPKIGPVTRSSVGSSGV